MQGSTYKSMVELGRDINHIRRLHYYKNMPKRNTKLLYICCRTYFLVLIVYATDAEYSPCLSSCHISVVVFVVFFL